MTDLHNAAEDIGATSLSLAQMPFIFTQDDLLTTDEFVRQAADRGYAIAVSTLEVMHELRILSPIFRVDDTVSSEARLDVPATVLGGNPRGRALHAAMEGRLRDPARGGASAAHPFSRPPDASSGWDNGYLYSSWQLLELDLCLTLLDWHQREGYNAPAQTYWQHRGMVLALCALSTLHLPDVVLHVRMLSSRDESDLAAFRASANDDDILAQIDFQPSDLVSRAESLLSDARNRDPMIAWLPLLRHAPHRAWEKMKGPALQAMWCRAGAEVLLLSHETLASRGVLSPLKDLTDVRWYTAQHDRLIPRYPVSSLERALARFGLSPYPRVILLFEGETEMIHIPALLADVGLSESQFVRCQNARSTKVNPHFLARYGVTPRIGAERDDGWDLDASMTALMIVMDSENDYATPEKCAEQRRNLQRAIREEIRGQGAEICQEDLDILVTVQTWGDDKYEIANFTDDELVAALRQFAVARSHLVANWEEWDERVRTYLLDARLRHLDIGRVTGQIGLGSPKVDLARLLLPVLREKLAVEIDTETASTPVVRLIQDVQDRVAAVDRASVLRKSDGPAG